MNTLVLGGLVVLAAAGAAYTVEQFGREIVMEGQHWIMLLVILIAGYVLGRLMPQLGQAVGLP